MIKETSENNLLKAIEKAQKEGKLEVAQFLESQYIALFGTDQELKQSKGGE